MVVFILYFIYKCIFQYVYNQNIVQEIANCRQVIEDFADTNVSFQAALFGVNPTY